MKSHLPLWQRLLITVLVMLAASYAAGLIWNAVLGFRLPSYVAGLVGGLAAWRPCRSGTCCSGSAPKATTAEPGGLASWPSRRVLRNAFEIPRIYPEFPPKIPQGPALA